METKSKYQLTNGFSSFPSTNAGSISPTVQFGDGSTAELVALPNSSNRLALNNLNLAYSSSAPSAGNGNHAAAAAANHAAAVNTVNVNNGGWPQGIAMSFFENASGYPTAVMGQATAGAGGPQGLELNNVRLANAANQLGQYGKC